MRIPVEITSHLRLPDFCLEYGWTGTVLDELTIPNTAKEVAKQAKRYEWWKMPDEFLLYDIDGDNLILPRGYAHQLKLLLREEGHEVQWVDKRTWHQGPKLKWIKPFAPRPHQPLAIKKMRRHTQGIYQAPTGSGKSLTCIAFIVEKRPKRSLILVDKKDLMNQWKREFKQWLGLDVGILGDGKWKEHDRVDVATAQTIWSAIKLDKLPEDFFERYDCTILDECHHVSAETIQHIMGKFWSYLRLGVSATPDRLDDKFEIAQAVLGEVFHEDDEDELIEAGVLIKPRVEVIRTMFNHPYWGDHEAEVDEDGRWHCDRPGCKIQRAHGHRNNYVQVKTELVSDPARNSLVISAIGAQAQSGPHHHLIVSSEVRHLELLHEMYDRFRWPKGLEPLPTYVLTGKVTGKKREQMVAQIKAEEECVVFATVAKEGLDIPIIDRVYLPFPTGNHKVAQQIIGRGTRVAEGKHDFVVVDFLDELVPVFKRQFRDRRVKLYTPKGFEVVM